MIRKRLQNKIAESRFAFPVASLYAIAVWLVGGALTDGLYLQFAMFAVSVLMMVTLNNSNSLIRIYSRMVSCSFIVMTCAAPFLFASMDAAVVQFFFILFYIALFRTYQDKKAPGLVFYSFACIGIASMSFVQILYFVPFLWILMGNNMMAISHKMFWASVLGIIAPYWFASGYYAWQGRIDEFVDHFNGLTEFSPLWDYSMVNEHHIVTLGIFAVLALIGIVHYLRNSYLDKIRTRMIFELFITVDVLTVIFLVLQPQHICCLLPIFVVNTSCLFAHFVALTKTRTTNIVFVVVCLMLVGLTAYNLLG